MLARSRQAGCQGLAAADADRRCRTRPAARRRRSIGPDLSVMATAAKRTIASVHEIAELGELDPESIVTPGIFVSKIVKIERVATQAGGFKK